MSTVGFGLKFTGDSRDAKRALKAVSGEIKGVGRAAKLMASPVAMAAAGVAAAALAAVALARGAAKAVSTLADWTAETAKLNDETAKNARNLGVSAEMLQALNFAAERAGASSASVAKALKQLAVQSANAGRKSAQQVETFKRLGVEFETTGGAMRSTEAIFRDVADAIQIQGVNSRTTADLSILLGRSGAELGNLMLGGSKGLDEMLARITELGALQGGAALFAAEQYEDAMTDFDTAMRGVRMEIGNDLIPVVTLLLEGFVKNLPAIKDFTLGFLDLGATVITAAFGFSTLYDMTKKSAQALVDQASATLEARQALAEYDAILDGLTSPLKGVVDTTRDLEKASSAVSQ